MGRSNLCLSYLCSIKHLTGMWHEQDALLFASLPIMWIDGLIVLIAQVDTAAAFFRDAGCQGYLDTRRFNTSSCVIYTCTLDVRTVGENGAWDIFEALPLFEKIIQ